jgi:hypothetical protein
VPSKPPLLSPSPVPSLPWWAQPSAERPKAFLVNWSAIVAATAVAFAGVVSAIAWIATHPNKATLQAEPTPALATLAPPSGAVALPPAPPPLASPAAPLVTIPVVHRTSREEVLVNHIPRDEEMPPPLPPPLSMPEPKCVKLPPAAEAPPAGETYGTQVLFLNNPEVAEETAQREKKLLFVMHISGNFEDSCFT